MGIKGLLGSLKPYVERIHVSKYANQRVGIDCYSWLHKGAYACSRELCESGGIITGPRMPAYVAYCAHRIQMLKYNKVIPIVIFDGARLPMKADTESERRRNKDRNLEEARAKLAAGDVRGAEEAFQRSVDITPEMALQVIKYLRKEGVEFVVAPYEADAQLAALANLGKENGGIAAVITEDSDLLAYGCSKVLYKMDKYGHAEEISMERMFSSTGPGTQDPLSQSQASSGRAAGGTCLSFRHFNQELFLGMCILAGCDFLPSIPGIGIFKAHAVVKKYRNMDRALSRLKLDAKLVVPPGYAQAYARARATFAHARVYDPASKRLVHLNPPPEGFAEGFGGDINFLGPDMPPFTARAIAEARVNPLTLEAFSHTDTDTWLNKGSRPGCAWKGSSEQRSATWRAGKSPKRAKKSPRKNSPSRDKAAHVDLSEEAEGGPFPFGLPDEEAPRPPATVDLSAFRNFVHPVRKGLGLNQSAQQAPRSRHTPSEPEDYEPMDFDTDGIRSADALERNRNPREDTAFEHSGGGRAGADLQRNEPPEAGVGPSLDGWETPRPPRHQTSGAASQPLWERLQATRPVLSDLPQNPFKRQPEERNGESGWVRQLTTVAPKPRKPLTSKPPRSPFVFGSAQEGKPQALKVSRFFAKPANPPFKPPLNPALNPEGAAPNPSVAGEALKPPESETAPSKRTQLEAQTAPGLPEAANSLPNRAGVSLTGEEGIAADVVGRRSFDPSEDPLKGASESLAKPSSRPTEKLPPDAGQRESSKHLATQTSAEPKIKESVGGRIISPSECLSKHPAESPLESPLASPQKNTSGSPLEKLLAPKGTAATTLASPHSLPQDQTGGGLQGKSPFPTQSPFENSIPNFGPSLDSDSLNEWRTDMDSQEVVPCTPSDEAGPGGRGEPLDVLENTAVCGLAEDPLESMWAATAASQAAANRNSERDACFDGVGGALMGSLGGAAGLGGAPGTESADGTAGGAEQAGEGEEGQACIDSNSGFGLGDDCLDGEKRVFGKKRRGSGLRTTSTMENDSLEETLREPERQTGVSATWQVEMRVDECKLTKRVEEITAVERVVESTVCERVEKSAVLDGVEGSTVLKELVDLETVELRGPASLLRFPRPMVPRRQTVKPSSILNFFRPVGEEGGEGKSVKRPGVEVRGRIQKRKTSKSKKGR